MLLRTLCGLVFNLPKQKVEASCPPVNVYKNSAALPQPQSWRSAQSPEQGNGGGSEDAVRFHGRSISHLPAEVLAGITHYLSMCEVLALGQVCGDLRRNLQRCGVITDIWNYLSLPKKTKRSVHRFVIGNRLLIDHLRNNPVGYSKSFPIQHSPAIYTKYISHFHELSVRASSINLVSIHYFVESSDMAFCTFNYQHNCMIQQDYNGEQLHVWTSQKDGFWEIEHTIDYQSFFIDYHVHDTGILIIGAEADGKSLLIIVERNGSGEWNVTQQECLTEISPSLIYHEVHKLHLAENQRVILCELSKLDIDNDVVLIFCLNTDGQWQIKYRFEACPDLVNEFQSAIGQDSGHIALCNGEKIFFVSEQDDGAWTKTGEIKSELLVDHKIMEFCPDDRHFVAWGEKKQKPCSNPPLCKEVCVIVASLDDQGCWSEVQRIDRTCDPAVLQPMSHAKFSLDAKQLFVCVNNELIILSLHAWVTSTHLLEPWDGSRCKIRTTMDPSLFMATSGKRAWIYAIDAPGVWSKQYELPCFPESAPKISADGNTVICIDENAWQVVLWYRTDIDQWTKQEFTIAANMVEFSPDGSLVAIAAGKYLVLLGWTEAKQWREKCRQRFSGHIDDLYFSPCGRTIHIEYLKGRGTVVTFWQIVPQE